ncbi:hypothetical protein AOLI_G00318860 [Acnodon oligacanthus]
MLFQGDDEVVKTLLPDQLENIRVIADDCLDLANKTEQRFTDVIKIIHELQELKEQTLKEANKRLEKAAKAMEKELQEEQDNYSKALESLPCGWDVISMDLFGGITDGIISTMIGIASAVSRAQLDKTREIYEKSVENMEKNQKELTEILITMRNCEVKEIDFNATIQILVKGMDAMGRVKEPWEKMVQFFHMVSNIVKTSLNRTLKDFASMSEKTQSLSYNSKLFFKDLLYIQAFQAINIASLIHMISATYTEVSDKYLMDRVSSLGKLMTMDKEKPEFKHEHLQLQNSCDEAQKGILRLVLKNKDEFKRKTDSRLEKIDKELLAILPSAAPEEMKRIQTAVKSGFTEEDEADY